MKTITKTTLISLAVASALAVAPSAAFAHKTGKKHTNKSVATSSSSAVVTTSSSEARLRALEAEVQSLRSELGRTHSDAKTAVATAQQTATAEQAVEAKLVEHEAKSKEDKNTMFFRGGYAGMTHNRNDELLVDNPTLTGPTYRGESNGGAGWYVGAGFDHRLTNDLWGMTDLVAIDAELMFQYMNFGQSNNALVTFATGGLAKVTNQVTQFTLTASPKIKFNTGTIFTPWVIPFGLSMNVISPPSSGVTVLNPGLMLGVGGEFAIWKALIAGIDFRYNFTGGDLAYNAVLPNGVPIKVNGMSTDGLTAGGYFGFKF